MKKKMTLIIISGVILLLGMWFVFFDTPKYIAMYALQSIAKKMHFSGVKADRQSLNKKTAKIKIEWEENLDGDFSFKDRWQYEEATIGFIVKGNGIMVTSGDEELSKEWSAKEDKIEYNKTHYYYTFKFFADGSEQLDFILAEQINCNTVECQSSKRISVIDTQDGYACLNFNIVGDVCYPVLGFTRYSDYPDKQFLQPYSDVIQSYVPSPFVSFFPCIEGNIKIDKTYWDKDWLKAAFSFEFKSPVSKSFPVSGCIYTPIQGKEYFCKDAAIMEYDRKQYNYRLSLTSKYE